ncbi:MAG: zinc ribbon domain-containing protein [Candidatus Neoclostridium sp.]
MICKKCGAENPNGVLFCGKCGERIDGKVKCPSCGKYEPSENFFCSDCGARMDGKKVCPQCGTPAEGQYCPACGAPIYGDEIGSAVKTVNNKSKAGEKSKLIVTKILTIVCNANFLQTALLSLLFIFLVGYNGVTTASGESKIEVKSVFSVFSSNWLCAVTFFVALAAMLVFAVISVLRFTKTLKGDDKQNLPLVAAVPVVAYYAFCIIFKMLTSQEVVYSLNSYIFNMATNSIVTLNAVTVFGMVFLLICYLASLVLHVVLTWDKKNAKRSVVRAVTAGAGILLAFITMELLGGATVNYVQEEIGESTSQYIKIASSFWNLADALENANVSEEAVGALPVVTSLFGVLSVCVLAVVMLTFINKLDKSDDLISTVCASIAAVLSLIFMMTALSTCGSVTSNVQDAYKNAFSSPMSVAVFVLSLLTLAGSVATNAVRKKYGDYDPSRGAFPYPRYEEHNTSVDQ